MKGIVLAGGRGSRLYPLTQSTCKQLLAVYDKPMIYYPLSVLMQAGIKEILIISTPEDLPRFEKMLGDGGSLGISLSYASQPHPEGIAQAFIIGQSFIGDDSVALILGDNIFYGQELSSLLLQSTCLESGAVIFGYEVQDPERYGVVAFDERGQVSEIIEKPLKAPSKYAVTGLYFYDNDVIQIAKELKPSLRGELEITDVNLAYLREKKLHVRLLGRGFAWLDTGTHEALYQASSYVKAIQDRQGIKIGCLEEVAYNMGFISSDQLKRMADSLASIEYGRYLEGVLCANEFK